MKVRPTPRFYKNMSYGLAIVFAAVGMIFLFLPNGLLRFFNRISKPMGMAESPENGLAFFLVLAVAYMYLVTLLAWMMGRHPENRVFPLLLANGKIGSSLVSFGFFFFSRPYLIVLSNGIIDGLIGCTVLLLYFRAKGSRG